jgi:hypothetical protein
MLLQRPGQTTGTKQAGSTLKRHKVDRRVLASSIDLDVELHAIAFIEGLHARTLDSADVHEGIRLAIITGDEAEALHRIEELDRAGRLLAGKLTLRSNFALLDGDHVANDRKVGGRDLAAAIDELEFKLLAFGQTFKSGPLDSADVNEDVIAAFIALDEAKALGCVEELYDATALADNLCGHSATARATAEAAATAAIAAAEATAATAAITAAAEAVFTTATAAETVTTTTSETIATAETVTAAETILPGKERIELVLSSEPIPLVASPSATTSVKTHVYERTFDAPQKHSPARVDEPRRASGKATGQVPGSRLRLLVIHESQAHGEQIYVTFSVSIPSMIRRDRRFGLPVA